MTMEILIVMMMVMTIVKKDTGKIHKLVMLLLK